MTRSRAYKGLTRRELLRRGGLVGVTLGLGPAVLAACGGGDGGGDAAATIETPPETGATVETGAVAETTADETETVPSGAINFISWQGYDLQGDEALVAWQDEHQIAFNATFIATHEDIQAKVTQSPSTYNLISYYQGYHDLYTQLDILSPLDRAAVPNYENNFDVFKGSPWWETDGELLGVPFTWGSWVIVYNPDKMHAPTSYDDLLTPSLKDKIAILDDPNGAMLVGGLALGIQPPDYTQEQVDAIIDWYRELRKYARVIAPSMGDAANLFASGEIDVVIPTVNTQEGLIKQQGANADAIVPSEGSATYCDAWAVPPEGSDRETALAWINHSLTPEVQAYTGDSLAQGITQPDAVELLDPAVRELFPYDDLDAWIAQAPFYPLPPENDPSIVNFQGWLQAWAAFKAEG